MAPTEAVCPDSHAPSFVRIRAGRIVEVHVRRMASAADVTELKARVSSAIASVGPGGVICADHRFASPLTPDVADAWSAAMRRRSRAPMRVGLLLDPSNTMYNLQIERVVQCVGNPGQRLFHDLHDLREWVGEALTEQERAALLDVFSDV